MMGVPFFGMAERLRINLKQILSGFRSRSRRTQCGPNHSGEAAPFAEVVTERRCLIHLFLRYMAPIHSESGLGSQFADEFAQSSSVAFAERMQAIQFAQIKGGAIGKGGDAERFQVPFRSEACERLVEILLHELNQSEWV